MADTTGEPQVTDHQRSRKSKRSTRGSRSTEAGEHAGDSLRRTDVDETGEQGAKHRGERNRTARIVNETGETEADSIPMKAPEAQQNAAAGSIQVSRARDIPVIHVELGIKPEPAESCRADNRDKERNNAERSDLADH